MTVEQAFELPEGRCAANVGFNVELAVQPHHVAESVDAIIAHFKEKDEELKAYSQAQIILSLQPEGER